MSLVPAVWSSWWMMPRCGRVDVRDGSPGTRETDLLDLTKEARAVNAGTPQETPDIVGAAP